MAPVSGEVVEKEKKPKKRFSLKSPKKKKEEPVVEIPAVTPELVLPTPASPGSVDDSLSMSAVSISDVSASDPNSSPKKGGRLNMSFRKKKKGRSASEICKIITAS